MLALVLVLLGLPVFIGLLLSSISHHSIRDAVVRAGSVLVFGVSVFTFVAWYRQGPVHVRIENAVVPFLFLGADLAVTGTIVVMSLRWKRYLALVLAVLQLALVVAFEAIEIADPAGNSTIFVDGLSLVMILVIGVVGSLIALFSVGYMKAYHVYHAELRDRRRLYYFLVFIFLSAMLGIVIADNLGWLLFFWEITTFCSFLLIGYTRTDEAIRNSFLALVLNLIGGICFTLAMLYLRVRYGVVELSGVVALGRPLALVPVALLSIAGLSKAAMLPFSPWLLGAMVAPTTVSALLHSSTMVKAGVYLLLRLAPVFNESYVGYGVTLIGGVTFLVTSILAVTQTDAKRLLAYSTIANLGLIAACAGIGTAQTVWAGTFIIIFHAIAKSLLFLSMGVVGYKLHSVDIEDMDNLILRFPMLTLLIVIGVSGMFIAPFGMLISKWAALTAFVDVRSWVSLILIACIAYGSAATLFFWTKWVGKMIAVNRGRWEATHEDRHISGNEWTALWALGILTFLTVLFFPLISSALVSPYIATLFGTATDLEGGNYVTTAVMIGMFVIILGYLIGVPRRTRSVLGPIYMSGLSADSSLSYEGSFGREESLVLKNYYLRRLIDERRLLRVGTLVGTVLTVLVLGAPFV